MRITILTQGSRGDFQPYIALGKGLQAVGHIVCLPAPVRFESLIREAGLTFVAAEALDPQKFMEDPILQKAARDGRPLAMVTRLVRQAGPLLDRIFTEAYRFTADSDLLIIGTIPFGMIDAAEIRGIPFIYAPLHPLYPTVAFPCPIMPPRRWQLNQRLNRFRYRIIRQLLWQMMRPALNKWRRKLGRPPLRLFEFYRRLYPAGQPVLYGLSPAVLPQPNDWPAGHQLSGYWFLDEPEGWEPPPELVQFLAAGEPPVCIGFGSMDDREPERMLKIVLPALRLSGQRAILLSGWSGLGQGELPETVIQFDEIPHSWLFPRVAAVVHHGGLGTTAAALRAGVPAIILPLAVDQPFWATRVEQLGAGVRGPSFFKVKAADLANALTYVTKDPAVREKVAAIGTQIRAEDGVGTAVSVIEAWIEQLLG